MSLTEAGNALLDRAELILQELRTTREELHAFAGLERGHVRVGTLPAHGAGWTVRMLGEFHRRYPNIELDLAEHNSAVLLELLLSRSIDVACMNVPVNGWHSPQGVCLAPIFQFELVFAVHPGHRLRNLECVPLDELVNEPLIMPPHSSLEWIVDQAFAARELKHCVRFHITDRHTLLEMAAEGIGVGVTTRMAIAQHPDLSVHAVEALNAELKGIGVAAWTERAVRNRAVQALVAHAQSWANTAHWQIQADPSAAQV